MTSIHSLPVELLDKIILYLNAHDTIRFCRAVRVLNEYAETIITAGRLLSNHLNDVWPNMTLYMRSIPVIVEHCAAVEALGTLISRFNGTTCFDIPMGFPLDQIENMCNVSSKKVMVMFGPVDSSAYYELAKHISRSGKTVVEIYLGHILSNITVDDIERVREALVVLDPLDITWFGDDIILPALYSCTRVYRLHLENIFCNSICISSILANMKSLKEISVAHLNKKMLLDLIRMLPSTNVQKLMLPGLDRDLKVWELRKLMEEAGYENRWPKHEQTGWYRCSAKKWK